MKYFILSVLIALAVAVAALPRKLMLRIVRMVNPFFGTPFVSIGRFKTSDGCVIYNFQWRRDAVRNLSAIRETLESIGHIQAEEEDMLALAERDDLPKTKSISSETIPGTVMTIHVNNRRPHEIAWGTVLPASSVDTYVSLAHCYERDKRKKSLKAPRSALVPTHCH